MNQTTSYFSCSHLFLSQTIAFAHRSSVRRLPSIARQAPTTSNQPRRCDRRARLPLECIRLAEAARTSVHKSFFIEMADLAYARRSLGRQAVRRRGLGIPTSKSKRRYQTAISVSFRPGKTPKLRSTLSHSRDTGCSTAACSASRKVPSRATNRRRDRKNRP